MSKNHRVSKPKHRRHQHLLEVSVRRDIARVQRIRSVFLFVCKTVLFVGLIGGAYLGGKECLRRFLWENPDYFLAEVRLSTDGTLTHEQVRTTANMEIGRNIFTIDIAKAREALDAMPQVESVELHRVLPNRIEVRIFERRPIAWLAAKAGEDPSASDKSFLVDSRGVAMQIKARLPEYLSLPVIAGLSMENLVAGQKVKSYEMQAALDLIRLNTDNTRFLPRTLDISKGYCVIVTDQSRRKVTFALERVDQQVNRLMHYIEFSETSGRQIQTVNLMVERNTPVLFAKTEEEEAAEEAAAQAAALNSKDAKNKAVTPPKKPGATPTPATTPVSTSPKSSTPPPRSKGSPDPIKKPFRLNG
ncbi:MAG: FtsQ-type POTRA domain-containing protein [Chthoniobacteraceae bacterium]